MLTTTRPAAPSWWASPSGTIVVRRLAGERPPPGDCPAVGMLGAMVLPGSYALSDLPADLPLNALADCIEAMREGHTTTATSRPDLVIIDCPGGDVAMARQAVYAADQVVIPLNFSALDMTANEATIHLIASVRQVRPRGPALAGLIPNRIQRGDTVARISPSLWPPGFVLLPAIPESNLIRRTGFDADAERRLVVSSHPKSRAAERFRLLHRVLCGEQEWSQEMGLEDLALQLRSSIPDLVAIRSRLGGRRMRRTRRTPSAVLTDQVAGDALGEILQAGSVGKLPEIRPSLEPVSLDQIIGRQ